MPYSQNKKESCGAAALLMAAHELGITKFENRFGYNWPEDGMLLDTDSVSESHIYYITSAGKHGYSKPDGIAKCAQFLGLTPTIYMDGVIVPKVLQTMYPTVKPNCEQLGVTIHNSKRPALRANERELVAVLVAGVFGLHWLLRRGHKDYWDPDDGKDRPGLGAVYGKTGISVVVSNP